MRRLKVFQIFLLEWVKSIPLTVSSHCLLRFLLRCSIRSAALALVIVCLQLGRIYCNSLYDLEERHGPFSCYGRIKANSAGENFNVTNINTKAGTPNRQIGLPVNSSFPYESKRSPFGRRHRLRLCFGPPAPLTLLKLTNGSLCYHSFFLNASSFD